jgi:hypothetical protein
MEMSEEDKEALETTLVALNYTAQKSASKYLHEFKKLVTFLTSSKTLKALDTLHELRTVKKKKSEEKKSGGGGEKKVIVQKKQAGVEKPKKVSKKKPKYSPEVQAELDLYSTPTSK